MASASVSTRDRLIEEAMRLFGEQGYRATSVAQIEEAAGLTPGCGGLYHHFRSKEALLDAGLERHTDRLRALRDINAVFDGVADLRTELVLLGRYALDVIDEEYALLRMTASELRDRPAKLTETMNILLSETYAGVAGWVRSKAPGASDSQAQTIATIALNALLAQRSLGDLVGASLPGVDDGQLVDEWADMIAARIEQLKS